MEQRYSADEVSYANLAFCRTTDGRIAVGAELTKRIREDNGQVRHEPYFVASLIYGPDDVRAHSVRQLIPVVAGELLRHVRHGTKLLILTGFAPHFQKRREIEAVVGVLAAQYGMEVRVKYIERLRYVNNDAMTLVDDAIRRNASLIASI